MHRDSLGRNPDGVGGRGGEQVVTPLATQPGMTQKTKLPLVLPSNEQGDQGHNYYHVTSCCVLSQQHGPECIGKIGAHGAVPIDTDFSS